MTTKRAEQVACTTAAIDSALLDRVRPEVFTVASGRTRPRRIMLPELLQTSPYLTHVAPGADPPVIYLTDTFGPTFPQGDPPAADVVFGIVGLDRQIVWQSDRRVLEMLTACAQEPCSVQHLVGRFGADRVGAAVDRTWLQTPDDLCREYRLVSGEIEVTAHCNWGCRFCPVATDPKPRQTMPMDLFEEIIAKLAEVATIDYVTFQFFNEPTLDKYFTDRLAVLAQYTPARALHQRLRTHPRQDRRAEPSRRSSPPHCQPAQHRPAGVRRADRLAQLPAHRAEPGAGDPRRIPRPDRRERRR
ncbi:radical SAM protein [Streptosporangium sp. NBC_01755]|uniref:radical SAM protein n=1 Tax=Streptosporangium sp. NBC_01755 TaxID=2975949 RepID=UPI002DD8DE73|nr:radical SAM protein [Streptosporangium sp. NBC_01755]WSC98071.1 radical SAM protein [Streptosporangium sp. NBC_01755]